MGVIRTALAVVATAAVLAGCDSAVGIPGSEEARDSASDESSETTTGTAPGAATPNDRAPAADQSPTPPPLPPPGPPVGEVPGNPDAATALRPFLSDLSTGGIGLVTARCWTVPPTKIPTMYNDIPALLDAAATPGVDGQFAVTWAGPNATVSIERSAIASGYACPMVYPAGTAPAYDAVDAVYTVDRYLGRFTGQPVNPADLEGDYPLVCNDAQTWDPQGTGALIAPPLANNPGILTGITGFDPDSVFVTAQYGPYTNVNADVVTAVGVAQNRTFILSLGGEGHCIGDIA